MIVTVILLLGASALLADSFPPEAQLVHVRMPVDVPMPAYLTPVVDPTFGTQITRVSDQRAMDSPRQVIAHHYAKDQPWNADGSLISLSGWPSAILDGRTYRFLRWIMPPGEHHTWSNTDPAIIYGIQQPNAFVSVNAESGLVTTLRVFDEYSAVSYGAHEGNLSNDDRYITFQCRAGEANEIIIYDIAADSVTARMKIGTLWPNNVTMSQSGKYVAVQWDVHGDGHQQGIDIFTRQFLHVRKVGTCGGCHYDLGYDTEGHEVAVLTDTDGSTRAIVAVRFEDGLRTTLLRDDQMSWYIHVSCRNLARPGWAYLTEFADPHTQVEKANYQLAFAVKIDGSGIVERFAHVHHSATVAYDRSPFGVPSRDGTRMMFRSDWEDGDGPVYSYIAGMPPRR